MLRIKIFVMSALVLALLSVVPAQAASVEGINHIGLLKAINAARGKVVVVNFFATWCMPCLQEIPGLMNIRSSFSEDDVMMVSVSVDKSIEEVQDFVDTNPFNYPVYWGDDAVARVFQISAIPKLLIYSQQGALAVKHEGFVSEDELREMLKELVAK